MHEHISPLLGEHPRIVNIFLGPVTVHYREVSLYCHLFRIAKIRASLTIVDCKTLVHALVISHLDYGNALLHCITDHLLHRLEMIQHSAASIKRLDRQSITAVLRQLHWLNVKWRINYKIFILGPSVAGLSKLLSICGIFGESNDHHHH